MNRILRLFYVDVRQGWRDSMTSLLLGMVLLFAVLIRLGLPWLVDRASGLFDARPYIPAVAGFLTLFPATVFGLVAGFLMLDEKDDRTLLALQVSPLSRSSYALYRVLSPVFLSVTLVVVILPLSGTIRLSVPLLLAAAILASLGAPVFAFLLAALAGNKIEGLALMKLFSLLGIPPIASLFLRGPWQAVLWPDPFYWPFRFIVRAAAEAPISELAILWLGGAVVHMVYLSGLFRKMAGNTKGGM